jgi:hypothetical protein
MLRKMLTGLALVVVAVAFGVGTASASPSHGGPAAGHGKSGDGFSDGRLAN